MINVKTDDYHYFTKFIQNNPDYEIIDLYITEESYTYKSMFGNNIEGVRKIIEFSLEEKEVKE